MLKEPERFEFNGYLLYHRGRDEIILNGKSGCPLPSSYLETVEDYKKAGFFYKTREKAENGKAKSKAWLREQMRHITDYNEKPYPAWMQELLDGWADILKHIDEFEIVGVKLVKEVKLMFTK